MPDSREAKDVKEVKEVEEKIARSAPVRNYTDLIVYRQAYRLALEVSRMTRSFPRQCSRPLTATRFVSGAPIRIAPGRRETPGHLVIASGETAETKFWLDLAADEGIADRSRSEQLKADYSKLGMMIRNLWKEWRKI